MLTKHYGRTYSIQKLRNLCYTNKHGSNLLGISDAAEKVGFRSLGVKLTLLQLKEIQLPCILHWRQNHFVVLYEIKNGNYYIADPATGLIVLSEADFKQNWFSHKELHDGVSLVLAPTPLFHELAEEEGEEIKWTTILKYFYAYKGLFFQLVLGLGVGMLAFALRNVQGV